jgi:hypothetical protein
MLNSNNKKQKKTDAAVAGVSRDCIQAVYTTMHEEQQQLAALLRGKHTQKTESEKDSEQQQRRKKEHTYCCAVLREEWCIYTAVCLFFPSFSCYLSLSVI